MNKKRIFSLFVILIFIMGISNVFAQGPPRGKVTSENTSAIPNNTLHVQIKTTGTYQAANSGGVFGLDSTRFTGRSRGIRINTTGAGNQNIAQGGTLSSSGYIRFEDNANATSTGAFKFEVNDTIFLSIQSAWSTSEKRFGFGNAINSPASTTVPAANRNASVGYNVGGSGASSMNFQFIDLFANPLGAPTTNNMGIRDLSGAKTDSLLAIVITQTHPASNNTYAQLNLTDLYLKPTGRWLGGVIEVQDTLLVAYGKTPHTVTPGLREENVDIRHNNPVDAAPAKAYFVVEDPDSTSGWFTPLLALGYIAGETIGNTASNIDSAWYLFTKTGQVNTDDPNDAEPLLWTPVAAGLLPFVTSGANLSTTFIANFKATNFDSVAVLYSVAAGRQPVSVRRGNSYWTYVPTDPKIDPYNGVTVFHNDENYLGLDSLAIAGAPILFMTLLPGDANFVRWNVGFGGFVNNANDMDFVTNGRLRPDGRLIPTLRRPNASGKTVSGYDPDIEATGSGTTTAAQAFTVVDTVTRFYDGTDEYYHPDTLFIFDADSNLSLDSTTAAVIAAGDAKAFNESSGTGAPIAMSGCWNVFGIRKYDTTYQPGRRIYDWGYDRANDQDDNRVRKIRLFAYLPGKTAPGQADTLNSAFKQILNEEGGIGGPTFASENTAGFDVDHAIWIIPGPISNMIVEWQKAGSSTWLTFPGSLSSSEAKTKGHKLRATLTDRCNNVIKTGLVAFNVYGSDTYLDTVLTAPSTGVWARGWGRVRPTTDTLHIYSRDGAGTDDGGVVQALFNTTCQNDEIYFAFTAYVDSAITSLTSGKPLKQIGGEGDQTYKITISGSTNIASIMMSNSQNDFIRSAGGGWPTPDTALVAARSSCSNDEVIFKIQAIDDCGHLLHFTEADTGLVQFQTPNWVKGGWNSLASWKRNRAMVGGPTGVYPTTGPNYWGKVLDEASGYGSWNYITPPTGVATATHDTVGKYIDYKYVEDGCIYLKYQPANTSQDTVSIRIKATTGGYEDETIIATLSTEPGNFRLYTRGVNDTSFVASRGDVEDMTKTTYAYGVLRDCNNELVSDEYDKHTFVYWRLLGTSRWSAFLFDPELAYNVEEANPSWLGLDVDIPGIKAYRGTRQLKLGINSKANNGRAYIGINSDTVGGANNVVGQHVFPIERDNVFPAGTYSDRDSLIRTYTWNGTEYWNRPYGLVEGSLSGAEEPTDENLGGTAPNVSGLATNNMLRNNFRGYNELMAVAYFFDGVNPVRKLETTRDNTIGSGVVGVTRYRVLADKINQIAFVDGTGDSFDKPMNDKEYQLEGLNFLNLYGRQAAKIKDPVTFPEFKTNRRVIAEENVINEGTPYQELYLGENSWKGGRSYAGRVVPLYIRLYDMYGNPIIADNSIQVTKGPNTIITNADDLMIPTLDGDTVYNQFFVSNGLPKPVVGNWTPNSTVTSRATAGAGSEATVKSVMLGGTGKLRGALRVYYQTLSHSGSSSTAGGAGTAANGGLLTPNAADDQPIMAKYVDESDLITLEDIGWIKSKKTGELASYKIIDGETEEGRVGIGNVIDWAAYDKVEDTYPEEAKLVWYDRRYYNFAKVIMAADQATGAPLLDLYPTIVGEDTTITPITVVPRGTQLDGFAQIAGLSSTYSSGWGDIISNDITWIDKKTPKTFGDFEAKEYSTGYLGGAVNTSASNPYGFFTGVGRIKIVPRKAGEIVFTIVDSVSNTLGSEVAIVGEPTEGLKILPGPIHWVAMSNPNAVNRNNEAVYPYPIRRDYQGIINFSKTKGPDEANDPDNKSDVIGRNPRSYAVPIDTIFVGLNYKLELRTYDRFGNRNTIDSIQVSSQHDGKGFWKDSWISGSEVLLDQDETKFDDIADVKNEFWTIPTEDNLPSIPDGGGFASQIRISYSSATQTTLNGIIFNKPDLLNEPGGFTSQYVAFRDVFVKKLEKPGPFSINNATAHNLVRLDDGNYNLSWTPASSTNNSDDGIEYNVRFYDGLTNTEINHVNVPYDPATRLDIQTVSVDPDILAEKLVLGPGNYNRNVRVIVEAKNKWGVTTNSTQTLDVDFELNSKPEAFNLIANGLANGRELHVNAAPFTLTWNIPSDFNGVSGGQSVTSYNKVFNLDTLEYQVVFELKQKFPPEGVADSVVTVPAINVGPGPAATITRDFLLDALAEIDGGIYSVYVVAKDRGNYRDWDDESCTTKSNVFTITFVKSGDFARILVDDVNKAGQPAARFPVASDHEFTLIATDADGNTIRAFSEPPTVNLKIFAVGIDASKYTGTQKLTLSVDGVPLAGDVANGFILPSDLFVEGQVTITYNNTKGGTVHINVPDNNPVFKAVDGNNVLIAGANTRDFITVPGAMEKLAVEVVPRQGNDIVFVNRKMEVIVSPADFYNNPIDSSAAMLVLLMPRHPDEFIDADFGATRPITGRTSYILTPKSVRDDQWFQAGTPDGSVISAPSNPFRIMAHAPTVPTLLRPSNNAQVVLNNHGQRQDFAWTKSTDPNNTPLISIVDGKEYNDVDIVRYTLRIEENMSYVMPDSVDTDEVLWATGATLYNLIISLGAGEQDKICPVRWYVVASDGLFETKSASFLLNLKPEGIVHVPEVAEVPSAFALGQNYPNPFNPTTNIQYDIPKASDVKIVIYNILGQPVRTLVNARQEAARYNVTWDGKNDQGVTVATGTYIYQIHAGEFSATKKMNLLK